MSRPLRLLLPILAVATVTFLAMRAGARPDLRPIVFHASSGRVKVGQEKQLCHRERLPRGHETEVGRVEMFVHGGSHHIHLYRPYNGPVDYPLHDCPFAIDFDHWQLVAATQTENLDWTLPPGVAIDFSPHQNLLIQTHFVNAGALVTKGRAHATIKLHPVDPSTVKTHAGAIFAQDRVISVPPGRTTLISRCALTGQGADARDMTILAFTGHYHFRGVEFQVFRVNVDGTLGERLYDYQGYSDPPFQQYKADANVPPLVLHAGEGIEWWCTYQNNTPNTFMFGANTQMNEHCNLFGFYYPTETPQEAIDCIHMIDAQGVEQEIRKVAQ
jgi:hypothetical protein